MKCSCGTKSVLNAVLGKQFYYCRACKDEIKEASCSPTINKAHKEIYDDWIEYMTKYWSIGTESLEEDDI